MTLPYVLDCEVRGVFGEVSQLLQPILAVLARAQSNSQVDVAGGQLEFVAFGTENGDIQNVELGHVIPEPIDATVDPILNHLLPKRKHGIVSFMDCFITS